MLRSITVSAVVFAATAGSASAAVYGINWLDMTPTVNGQPVPNNSNFFLAGVGNVNVTYNISGVFSHARLINPSMQGQNIVNGPDTYQWGNHELFAATLLDGPDPLVPVAWDITYTFQNAVAAGSLYVGVAGLGQTTSFGGGATVATVNQNGTFLGDFIGSNNWGATQFTPGAGTFSMQNSVTGAGGIDPHWNSGLGLVRIDDTVSSLTVHFSHIRGDGAGVNIGYVPAPASVGLLGLGGLMAGRRRR
jgi:hypothetical protein|tara:strand:- start:5567 stop:6310 length:744 start_codon:yes stop_codon:yes gene_type:complete